MEAGGDGFRPGKPHSIFSHRWSVSNPLCRFCRVRPILCFLLCQQVGHDPAFESGRENRYNCHPRQDRKGRSGMPFAARLAELQPTAVNRVLEEVSALQRQGRQLVSLMRGQPDTPTPPHIVEAAERALRGGRTGYPDNQGEPELRRAVAERLKRDNGLVYDPDREILITDGATAGL